MSTERPGPHYRTLSTVAANVAAGAALAAHTESHDPQHRNRWRRSSVDQLGDNSRGTARNDDDVDDDALAAMADSFHSEGGRKSRRKIVSWNREHAGRSGSVGRSQIVPTSPLPSGLQITASQHPELARGRSLQRDDEGEEDEEAVDWSRSRTTSTHRTSSRASRRGAGMVLFGVWALFGIGTLAGSRNGSTDSVASLGRVLTGKPATSANIATPAPTMVVSSPTEYSPIGVVLNDSDVPQEGASRERILGRIFAWSSTTLYMTSRLPQIWKNVRLPSLFTVIWN